MLFLFSIQIILKRLPRLHTKPFSNFKLNNKLVICLRLRPIKTKQITFQQNPTTLWWCLLVWLSKVQSLLDFCNWDKRCQLLFQDPDPTSLTTKSLSGENICGNENILVYNACSDVTVETLKYATLASTRNKPIRESFI